MTNCLGLSLWRRSSLRSVKAAVVSATGLLTVACSADVTRFDNASFNLNDPPETTSSTSPSSRTSVNDSAVQHSVPRGPYGAGASSVDVAALPEPAGPGSSPSTYGNRPSYGSQPSYQPTTYNRTPDAKPFGSARREATYSGGPVHNAAPAKGELIEVRQGDTLYALSKRHKVSLNELMSVNGLKSPNLKPGQKLYLPAGGASSGTPAARAVEAATPAPAPLTPVGADVTARYGGTYTVKAGDSLYAIARSHKVKFAELQRVNGITDPKRVKPGTVLRVPGSGAAPVADTAPPQIPSSSIAQAEEQAPSQSSAMRPSMLNGEKRVAEADGRKSDGAPVANDASRREEKVAVLTPPVPPADVDSVKLRWPAIGRVVVGFGGRPDGTHNDGVNIAVPLGTEVHAAEGGVVVYAGSELKGYGNLVLLRHDNGWVTAYAHNDELSVKRGDKVARGQVIAKAGKTGSVDQPQVHFELRQGSKPVDPMPYLERL